MPLPDGRRRTDPECYRQSSSHAFILFAAICGADSSSSDLHFGNRISVSAPVSCLLAVQSAMTGFRPDSFRCFGTVLCAQLRSSGFPFLLRQSLPSGMPRLLYIGWQYEIVRQLTLEKAKSCAFPSATIHDMGVICKRFEKNMPHLFQPLEKSRSLCQNKENRCGGFSAGCWLDKTNWQIWRNP